MRLAGISSINQTNEFLKTYLPIYNKRFATHPKSDVSFFERPQKSFDYKWTFVVKEQRTVGNDYTIRYQNKVFLIEKPSITQRKQQVTIKQSLDKDLRFEIKGKKISVKEITDLIDQHSEQKAIFKLKEKQQKKILNYNKQMQPKSKKT